MFRGAIFDMDGTILDSMEVWSEVTKSFFADRNIRAENEDIAVYKDMTLQESLPIIRERYRLSDSVEEMCSEFNKRVAHEYTYTIAAKPYVCEYIRELYASGIKIALATSGYRELCEAALRRIGIADCVEAIALSSEVGVNKSNPDVYLLAAERIGIPPEECMVFEDILLGVGGAKKANMQTTAVYDKSSAADTEALRRLADRYIVSWRELLA